MADPFEHLPPEERERLRETARWMEDELRAFAESVIGQQFVVDETVASVRGAFCHHFEHELRARGCAADLRAELLASVVAEVDPEDTARIVIRTSPELQEWLDLRPFKVGLPPVP